MTSAADPGSPIAAPPLPTLVLVACIVAMVLGVIGLVGGLIQVVALLAGGGLMAFAAISNIAEPTVLWMLVSVALGLIIVLLGLLLSLIAGIAGLMGILRKSVGLLKWAAILLVLFDVLAHLVWPIISFGISAGIQYSSFGSDALTPVLAGLPGLVITFVVSLVITVVWGAIGVICMRYKPQEATLV